MPAAGSPVGMDYAFYVYRDWGHASWAVCWRNIAIICVGKW